MLVEPTRHLSDFASPFQSLTLIRRLNGVWLTLVRSLRIRFSLLPYMKEILNTRTARTSLASAMIHP